MKLHTLALATLALSVAALAACGGGSGPKIKSFAASDTSVPNGGADVTFTWDVSNTSSIELQPFPGAVSGSSATVTVTEDTTFTLVAKKNGRSAKRSIDITVGAGFNVTGRVNNLYTNGTEPAIGATVAIGDRVTVTNENGQFHFDDVVAPYDLVVMTDYFFFGGSSYYVSVYKDVTISNPTVSTFRPEVPPSEPSRSATISGTVSGGAVLPAPNTTNYFWIDNAAGGHGSSSDSDSTYSVGTGWYGEASTEAIVNVLQHDNAADTYFHARSTGTATDLGNLVLNPALASVTKRSFDIELDAPWRESFSYSMQIGFNESGRYYTQAQSIPLVSLTTNDELVTSVPDVENLFSRLSVSAYDSDGEVHHEYLYPDEVELTSITFEPPPRLLTPIEGASVGPDTKFTIASPPGNVNIFNFFGGSFTFGIPGPGPSYNAYLLVYTDETELTFPDLSALGLPFPTGQYLVWGVASIGPWNSLDEALASVDGPDFVGGGFARYGYGDGRSFYTEGDAPGGGDDDDDIISAMEAQTVAVPEN